MVAEGFARFTTADTIRYLRMARGELAEVQNHIEAGRRRDYFPAETHASLATLARRAMGTTTNFLKAKVKQREQELNGKRSQRTGP
jgi:four helix bundle protein